MEDVAAQPIRFCRKKVEGIRMIRRGRTLFVTGKLHLFCVQASSSVPLLLKLLPFLVKANGMPAVYMCVVKVMIIKERKKRLTVQRKPR